MDGIIPARAGFTPASRSGQSHHRNHPRSRGVYGLPHSRQAMGPESSPLARGLRRREAQYARESADHPCSRGVYYSPPTLTRDRYGSSPLARGLRMVGGAHLQAPGIIPARAGFTRAHPHGHSAGQDHPRSRGVYLEVALTIRVAEGSSPLARGLRDGQRCPGRRGGIIPARAGFTSPGGRGRGPRRDHPRSRGVYRRGACRRRTCRGSSPLARGLRDAAGAGRGRRGIIPARAGFTT